MDAITKRDLEQLTRIKRGLQCSDEEALSILAYDKQVDKGEKTEFDLSPDKLKSARQYTHTGTRKVAPIPKGSRTRPKDATKEQIITIIADFLRKNTKFATENVEIVNSAKVITFKIGEQAYKIDLTATRKPKS